ncbi:YfhO family protein [Vagococcus sp.]|uniref:YfhO family protein n=1 Tax=Vagococcus sp. TaxID=1933889 RepID=UPI002FCAB4D8
MTLTKLKKSFKNEGKYGLAAFFIPFFIMLFVYLSIGIFWGSDRSVLASDAFSQFSNFHASFNNVLHGDQSIFYTWNASLGLNYWSLISYYLGGIFTPLVFFFNNQHIPDALYLLTLLKIGSAGLAFWYYGKNTYKLSQWSIVTLSVSYSLMSFITAHSELIMWLDIFMYLPLVILGINQVMDKGKSILLFVSYLLLFVSNFYFGFMIGVFSVVYFFARLATNPKQYKKSILPYFVSALLAGISSMIMILPAVLDLKTNGETLTEMARLKTEATSFWDIIIKNMIGVFDTTKYGSIPFIYVGILPLIFCIFYFVTKKIKLTNKIAYGSMFILLIASFYLEPLNLFWHGFHAPNMFLFRFSFLFSFLVVMLAGYGWEKFTKEDGGYLVGICLILPVLFLLAKLTSPKTAYDFATPTHLLMTILFVLLYLTAIIFYQLKKLPGKRLAILLLLLVSGEAFLNTSYMLNGILDDWNYASRSLYSEPYPNYKKLVDTANKANKEDFYRLESLAPISSNDSFSYGYSGISMFSSIRNRHSSKFLNDLGYRSRGTSLNIRYQNNTLFMDSLLGVKHNISDQRVNKYGFTSVAKAGKYQLYENEDAMPLGVLTEPTLYRTKFPKNDNLGAQTALINQLSNFDDTYYSFVKPTIAETKNTKIINKPNNHVLFKEIKPNIAKSITYDIFVPAGNQAYLSLFPGDFSQIESSSATVLSQGTSYKSQINITGQYYNLGYFEKDTTLRFTLELYGTKDIDLVDPPVVLMDTNKYQSAMNEINKQGVNFDVSGRKAKATVETPEDKVLMTTIPYDKGWTVKVDGKKVPTKDFKKAFLTFSVPKGKHEVTMSFLPPGLLIGVLLFISGIGIFSVYYIFVLNKKRK